MADFSSSLVAGSDGNTDFLGQILSTKEPVSADPLAQYLVPNADAQVTRQIANAAKEKITGQKTLLQSLLPQDGAQPAATPPKQQDADPMPMDTYRYGGGATDETINPRTLGEREEKPENIASISVTMDFSGVQDPSNPFSGIKGKVVNGYSRFFLQNVTESQSEKYQILETFTSFYVFFYGRRPSVYRFSGTLLNDPTHRWANDMLFYYENYLRGTRNVEFNGQGIINYDSTTVTGFILNLVTQRKSDIEREVPFTMDFLVLDHQITNFSTDIADLISKKTQELQQLSQAIQQQIALVSKDVQQRDILFLKKAATGALPPTRSIPLGKSTSISDLGTTVSTKLDPGKVTNDIFSGVA